MLEGLMPYRILSLDGGGTWALLQAIALAEIYGHDATGHVVLADFDMAVANSGGSIVLAGLMADFPLARLIALFGTAAQVQSIFVKLNVLEKLANPPAKYSTEKKLSGLRAVLAGDGDRTMDQWTAHLPTRPGASPLKAMIVGFDYDTQRAEFFRTYVSGLGAPASNIRLVDAVHASSDAPVAFFNKPTECGGHRYWDGAVAGFNNPLMGGVTEALALGVDPAPGLPTPVDSGPVVRLNASVQPLHTPAGWAPPPGYSLADFKAIANLAMDAREQSDIDRIKTLAAAWIAGAMPNQPIRSNAALERTVGDPTFAAAVARW
jgi:hypothetical protein